MKKLLEWLGCAQQWQSSVCDLFGGYDVTDASKVSSRKYIRSVELVKDRKMIPGIRGVFGNVLVKFADGSVLVT